jgi:hypothetical protein
MKVGQQQLNLNPTWTTFDAFLLIIHFFFNNSVNSVMNETELLVMKGKKLSFVALMNVRLLILRKPSQILRNFPSNCWHVIFEERVWLSKPTIPIVTLQMNQALTGNNKLLITYSRLWKTWNYRAANLFEWNFHKVEWQQQQNTVESKRRNLHIDESDY